MARGSTIPTQSGTVRGQNRREEGAAGGKGFLHHLAPLARGLLLAAVLGVMLLTAAVLGMEEQKMVALVSPSATEPETATPVATPTATRPNPTTAMATPIATRPNPTHTPTETVPTSSPTPSPVPPSATPQPTVQARCVPPSNWRLYTVGRGESLSSLAWRYWTSQKSLVEANCLTSYAVYVGQRIYIPNVSPRQSCGRPSGWVAYLIQRGDTLSSIARQTGTTVAVLKQANCLKSDRIYAGATLWVPRLPPPTRTPRPTATRRPTYTPTPTPTPTPDTTPPETTIISGPDDPTTSTVATFTFSADEQEVTFECALDKAAFVVCTSPQSYADLSEGNHTFQVRATDAAGNTDPSPASYGWMVEEPTDTTPPETTISSGPNNPTTSTKATFVFAASEVGATFQCALDGEGFTGCTSPKSYAGLSVGSHTFQVRATDAAGNTDPSPASYSWTIEEPTDTTPPETTISSGPNNPTTSTQATFVFAASEVGATFQCALDGGGFVSCTSPKSYTGLSVGSHTFQVRATDAAGNTDPSPASYSWTIEEPPDTMPPETTISSGPNNPTTSTKATFVFAASEAGATFQCALDGGGFVSCTSPKSYADVSVGSHTFQVRATDAAGNTDPSPASYGWTVEEAPADARLLETVIDPRPVGPKSPRELALAPDHGASPSAVPSPTRARNEVVFLYVAAVWPVVPQVLLLADR
jgi:LysM repeat protein